MQMPLFTMCYAGGMNHHGSIAMDSPTGAPSFKDISDEKRPAANMRRIVVFPNEDKPRFMWAAVDWEEGDEDEEDGVQDESDDDEPRAQGVHHPYYPDPRGGKTTYGDRRIITGNELTRTPLSYTINLWFDRQLRQQVPSEKSCDPRSRAGPEQCLLSRPVLCLLWDSSSRHL